ncbi:CYFA0S01e11452g1_1 [Cyberlindnera fabianii]|uniref:Large ribosomal subunit protein uL29m n=1 Tax=Cyberlindnera fabianii TaxID=36022 RepID=A0A061AS44_CYBFA|nr:hypothetical protein BON22_0340 [Cyberlindnera fabianii]CDR37523.1 CYFA0S01e11452g1_1 [Cyberlindnera fabianii]
MFSQVQKRSLHTTTQLLARQKRGPLQIRPPITPTVKNFEVSPDHPLWQFFHDKKYLRTYEDIDSAGRPWTVPELRRKSFDDLHSLWYSCLKERNVLAREIQVLLPETGQPDQQFLAASDRVRETMWRIRHVLSERAHAQDAAREIAETEEESLVEEFKEFYLEATADEEAEAEEALRRFSLALYGIPEAVEETVVNKNFLKGIKVIANLKVERFGKEHDSFDEIFPITDAVEAFTIFAAESNKTEVSKALDDIKTLRESNERTAFDEYSDAKKVQILVDKFYE